MSSPSNSSSGTGGRSRPPLRQRSSRTILRWPAAALAAAAAVWTPLAVLFAGETVAAYSVLAALAAAFAYVALAPCPRRFVVGSFAAGVVLNVGALVAAFVIFAANGSCNDEGGVAPWMWGLGIAVVAACAAWALQRPSRTWWGLPAATILGAIVVTTAASIVTGSTGLCLE